MPAPRHSMKRGRGFQQSVADLSETLREVEATLQARVFLLVVRDSIFLADRHVRRRRQKKWVPVTGCARRRKEVFKQKRDSMVRQANRISSRYSACVWIYMQRNSRWYAYNVDFQDVSAPGQIRRRSMTDGGQMQTESSGDIDQRGTPRMRSGDLPDIGGRRLTSDEVPRTPVSALPCIPITTLPKRTIPALVGAPALAQSSPRTVAVC